MTSITLPSSPFNHMYLITPITTQTGIQSLWNKTQRKEDLACVVRHHMMIKEKENKVDRKSKHVI